MSAICWLVEHIEIVESTHSKLHKRAPPLHHRCASAVAAEGRAAVATVAERRPPPHSL